MKRKMLPGKEMALKRKMYPKRKSHSPTGCSAEKCACGFHNAALKDRILQTLSSHGASLGPRSGHLTVGRRSIPTDRPYLNILMWRYRVTPHRITVQGMIRRASSLQLVAECPDVRAAGPGGLTRLNLALTMTIIAQIRNLRSGDRLARCSCRTLIV